MTTQAQTLIKVLEEWVVKQGKEMHKLNDPNYRYNVQDFFNVQDVLFLLKGVKGEKVEIRGKEG